MTTIRAHFDGKAFIPDEPVDVPVDEPLTLQVESAKERLTRRREEQLAALREMEQDTDPHAEHVDDSRDSIYSGTIDDPR